MSVLFVVCVLCGVLCCIVLVLYCHCIVVVATCCCIPIFWCARGDGFIHEIKYGSLVDAFTGGSEDNSVNCWCRGEGDGVGH